jgi:hypothetical protein
MSPTAIICIAGLIGLVLVLVYHFIVADDSYDPDWLRPNRNLGVDHWSAEVEGWRAQLAEIRNLPAFSERDDPQTWRTR